MNSRLVINSLALNLRMVITMLIGFYSSRLLLHNLGVEDYGIYNVVGGLVGMFSVMNAALSDSSQRYLNYYLGQHDEENVNRAFSTSIYLFVGIGVLFVIVCEAVGIYLLEYRMVIPAARLTAARVVFQFTLLAALINIVSTPYNSLIIAKERMTTFAYVAVVQSVMMLMFALLIPFCTADRLIFYALLVLALQVGIRMFYGWYSAHSFLEIKFLKRYDRRLMVQMAKFSGWSSLGVAAYITYNQGLTVLINTFCGPLVNAAQALAIQVNGALNNFSANVVTAAKPQIVQRYAQGQLEALHRLVTYTSKLSYGIMLVVTMPFFVQAEALLSIWLGEVPPHTASFLRLLLASAVVTTLSQPAVAAVHATGRIRSFQIAESCCLFSILPLSYLLLTWGCAPASVYGVVIGISLLTQVVRAYYMKVLTGLDWMRYLWEVLLRMCLVVTVAAMLCLLAARALPLDGLAGLGVTMALCVVISSVCFYYGGLSRTEREKIRRLLTTRISARRNA